MKSLKIINTIYGTPHNLKRVSFFPLFLQDYILEMIIMTEVKIDCVDTTYLHI